MRLTLTWKEIFELINRWSETFASLYLLKNLEWYDEAIKEAEELFEMYDFIEKDYQNRNEKWNQYKAIKELTYAFEKIVMVKSKNEPNEYWKRKNNRIQNKQQLIYKEILIENVLDCLWIKHSRLRCACPVHEWKNRTSFSFKWPVYKCFKCDSKGNWFQLAITLWMTKEQIKQL